MDLNRTPKDFVSTLFREVKPLSGFIVRVADKGTRKKKHWPEISSFTFRAEVSLLLEAFGWKIMSSSIEPPYLSKQFIFKPPKENTGWIFIYKPENI